MDLYEEPDLVKEMFGILNEQAIEFAIEQINSGADVIGIGDAAASLISPECYKEFVLPYEIKLIKAVHNKGAKAKLHICGNIDKILDDISLTKADIVNVDSMVDFKKAIDKLGDCRACGNFDPVEILFLGNKKIEQNAVKNCVEVSKNNTFIAAGCEVPRDTPLENLLVVKEMLKNM
jgi:uroporphyrinogen-III decarboxylase